MRATKKRDLREAKERTLKNYYATLAIRRQFEQLGQMAMVTDCERIMALCMERLCMLRAQEIMGSWPQLLPAHC